MRILFVIGSLHVGGAERQMVLLIQGLIQRGISCEVFVLTAEGSLMQELSESNVTIHDGGYQPGAGKVWAIRQLLKALFGCFNVVRRGEYDVIHSFLPLANFIGMVTGKFLRVPLLVSSKRALGTHQERFPIWSLFDRTANWGSDIISVNSMGVWHDVIAREQVDESKLKLIYNGINLQPFKEAYVERAKTRQKLGLHQDSIAIIIVANLIPYKGHSDAIKAIGKAISEYPEIKLLLAGEDRGIQVDLANEARKLNIADNVQFLGRRDDVPELLFASDIGLVASHEEGFCNALLEMMSAELPVVATDVGGNAEALESGKLGLLAKPHEPETIAQAIMDICKNRDIWKRISKDAAATVANKYSASTMVSNYQELYHKL